VTKHHLAQLNIAKLKYAIDDPELSEFMDNLDNINTLADESPGFVWRLQTTGPSSKAFTFKQTYEPE